MMYMVEYNRGGTICISGQFQYCSYEKDLLVTEVSVDAAQILLGQQTLPGIAGVEGFLVVCKPPLPSNF